MIGVKVTGHELDRQVVEDVVDELGVLELLPMVIRARSTTAVEPLGTTISAVMAVTLGLLETVLSYMVISPVIGPPMGFDALLPPKRASSSKKPLLREKVIMTTDSVNKG